MLHGVSRLWPGHGDRGPAERPASKRASKGRGQRSRRETATRHDVGRYSSRLKGRHSARRHKKRYGNGKEARLGITVTAAEMFGFTGQLCGQFSQPGVQAVYVPVALLFLRLSPVELHLAVV